MLTKLHVILFYHFHSVSVHLRGFKGYRALLHAIETYFLNLFKVRKMLLHLAVKRALTDIEEISLPIVGVRPFGNKFGTVHFVTSKPPF